MTDWPEQVAPGDDRASQAPYNFVPLPRKTLTASKAAELAGQAEQDPCSPPPRWRRHDEFVPGTLTGWIDVEIVLLSPLFVGSSSRDGRPAMTPEGKRPVIPGSGWRGAIRSLVEILAFARLEPVDARRRFFRAAGKDKDPLARAHRKRVGRPIPAFVRRGGSGWEIEPAAGLVRVPYEIETPKGKRPLASISPLHKSPNYTPPWRRGGHRLQHARCWVLIGRGGEEVGMRADAKQIAFGHSKPGESPNGCRWRAAVLVLTGGAGYDEQKGEARKRREFAFLLDELADDSAPARLEIDRSAWQEFHGETQMTRWQKHAYPKDQPPPAEPGGDGREADGALRDGEPVFFAQPPDGEKVRLFGRPSVFRIPYDLSPRDLVRSAPDGDGPDLAQAIFGTVDPTLGAIKGRLRFEDAIAQDTGWNAVPEDAGWLVAEEWKGALHSPSATAFGHYLVQSEAGVDRMRTYLRNDREKTAVRGHKLYWHRWDPDRDMSQAATKGEVADDDEQSTALRPVRHLTDADESVTFRGRVRFRNLAPFELGAVLAALELPAGCAHKLGMGRALGLGSVRMSTTINMLDLEARYATWDGDGARTEQAEPYKRAFAELVHRHAEDSGETIDDRAGAEADDLLCGVGRLGSLYAILDWERAQPERIWERTKQASLDDYRRRRILPPPEKV